MQFIQPPNFKMKFLCIPFLALLLVISCKTKIPVSTIQQFEATETYPNDTYLDTVSNKRALIISAHDDDDCFMAGTIYKLKQAGWEIEQWTFRTTPLEKGNSVHPAEIICKGNKPILEDGLYRNVNPYDSTRLAYLPIPREHFAEVFKTEKVKSVLEQKINAYKPTVIFSMDNEMGGYGHPEHVFVCQILVDLFKENKIPIQRIYQGVTTNHMEEEIIVKYLTPLMEKWGYPSPYLVGREVYKIAGIPEPDVQVDISAYADGKMRYLRAFSEDAKKNIRKFIPYYEDFDAKTYFGVFNREFYRVMKK